METAANFNAIAQVLDTYVQGGIAGKGAQMAPAFDPLATIFMRIGDTFVEGPIQILFDIVDQNPGATNLTYRVVSIVENHGVATAELALYDWGGFDYTDYMSLVKKADGWKIVNKLSVQHPK